eukprot:TRINITY_DN7125_c0_g1_i1.p1 TRINITY_DN7125_c0_g1~~TRINITY_DN7125_c0_g1_i1.p1  ORF type:complete len:599 (-),score=125.02 TRINITY_DN7125_c0_g1_i1:12-1808(-)
MLGSKIVVGRTGLKFASTGRLNRSNKHGSKRLASRNATMRSYSDDRLNAPRDSDQADVVIVGGGPSGLATAIRIKQMCKASGKDLRVCLLEKGAEMGNHILSGCVLEPRALNELLPNWKELGSPIETEVTSDSLHFLTEKHAIPLPIIDTQDNHGNYIVSLGQVVKWMSEQAEQLGVEIFPGFPAAHVLYNDDGSVKGVATGDVGIGKDGQPTDNFTRGLELHAPITVFAEGARGSLTKQLFKKFDLRKGVEHQTFGLGIKEVWEIQPEKFQKGKIQHTMGWPVDMKTWGGGFIYHWKDNLMMAGYVVGLDYENPYLSPYQEMQRWKQHSVHRHLFEGGKPIAYGARSLNEGGLQSIPKLAFPGGALVGCTAGFLNVPKIKGTHTAMKTGMLAGESIYEALTSDNRKESGMVLTQYEDRFRESWVYQEMHRVRNIRPAFHWGTVAGAFYTGLDWLVLRGREPWTFSHGAPDHARTKKASEVEPIQYPKPDGKISFDLLTNLARSGTNHEENQPAHLKVRNPETPVSINLKTYAAPESRFCPAGVYEYVDDAAKPGQKRLQINAQNCLHCKTCDIKDPTQNIDYTTPEGGGGPAYSLLE